MMRTENSVEMRGIGKRFARQWTLAHVDLLIGSGETVALFGKNGSGKTTLLKIIATLLAPTTGQVKVLGYSPGEDRRLLRKRIRLLGHEKQLYSSLTVLENLRLVAGIRGVGEAGDERRVFSPILERLDMLAYAGRRVNELSEGMKKRVVLGRLLIGEADLILLDEPHPTLDKEGREILNQLILDWRKEGKTLMIASHDHEQTLTHASRLLVIRDGCIGYDGPPVDPEKIL